ncbi:MAG: sulfotransferase [Rhodanobacteraceae bacterium]|nr:sulfotransferase [Rhodanobacteraceae bacterium]MBP9155050.1 sulfotransferase [Xanthomonadales bacterium]HQW82116.1 sulfotransferase [Pseudomonadota bacterium]
MRNSAPVKAAVAGTAAKLRTAGLPPKAGKLLNELAAAHARGDQLSAEAHWLMLSLLAPTHPEVQRWSATLALDSGDVASAIDALQEALQVGAKDPDLLRLLATAFSRQGNHDTALRCLTEAEGCTKHVLDWLDLGIAFDQMGQAEYALRAADRALALQPALARARLLRVRCLQALGQITAAAAECRQLIRRHQEVARAWFSLLDLKIELIDAGELAALERAERQANDSETHCMLGFALGRAYEAAHRFDDAYVTFGRANRIATLSRPWNATHFSADADAIGAAFARTDEISASCGGAEVLFLVSLPRSGSTLFEQVLAAHPQVEGASELPYLEQVIAGESRRRQRPLAQWAEQATAQDWSRLGQEYLQRSARWRSRRPMATDKMPSNWLLAGAAMAMLPESRIVDCRRDPLETCWSCYKQLFAPGKADYAYAFDHLASYWQDYWRLTNIWSRRNPRQFRSFSYEHLVANPEREVRALLEFCRLPFDSRCLQPHEAQRTVRTASAAQVRQPIHQKPLRSNDYGPLLDPLRQRFQVANPDLN